MADTVIDLGADTSAASAPPTTTSAAESLQSRMGGQLATELLSAGRAQAEKAYTSYVKIDFLRPYFVVEPADVRSRLMASLLPRKPTGGDQAAFQGDLYSPLMLVLTLVTVLLYGMKAGSAPSVGVEGTVMGTALFAAFGYWFGASTVFSVLAYVFNCNLSIIQVLSLTGYGIFGYCIVLVASSLFPSSGLFYVLWLTIGLACSLRIASEFFLATTIRRQGFLVGAVVAAVHWLYLYYLKYAYHSFVAGLVH